MSAPVLDRPMFLFDADCGVCQNGTDAIRDRIDPPVDIVAFQSVDHDALGVTAQELAEGPVFVSPDGWHVVGPAAMAHMMRTARAPYRAVGAFLLMPGVRHLLAALGPAMYRNRSRLPGSTPACEVRPAA
jgi:predicted DCC family thiol-disulfide oxidoreductase YuxK